MKILFVIMFIIVGLTFPCWADEVNLAWDASTESNLKGYNIYRAERIEDKTTAWEQIGTVAGDISTYIDEVDNKNYAYMVTAFDATGKESFPSNMVERYDRTPFPSVRNLRKYE